MTGNPYMEREDWLSDLLEEYARKMRRGVAELEAQLEASVLDTERVNWLSQKCATSAVARVTGMPVDALPSVLRGAEQRSIRAAIDAAMLTEA